MRERGLSIISTCAIVYLWDCTVRVDTCEIVQVDTCEIEHMDAYGNVHVYCAC